jgi:hypothetical protein
MYREREEKVDLMWHPHNYTVSYRRQKTWWFEPEMSVGPLTDTVTTVNLPMLAAADSARGNFFMEFSLSDMFSAMEVSQASFFLFTNTLSWYLSLSFSKSARAPVAIPLNQPSKK